MNVTLRQLRAFIAVADLGRFNLAADRLGLTQSAASVLIKNLEDEVGQRLFHRHTRMVGLTAAGQEFLPQARRVLEDLERAVGSLHDQASMRRGEVSVAVSIVLAATFLPPIIAGFLARYPGIQVRIHDMPEEEIRPALRTSAVDLAIGTVSESDTEIEAVPIMSDRLTVICRADHRFAGMNRVRWRDLSGESLIVLAKENPLRSLVDRSLEAAVPDLTPAYEVRFSTTAISMIAAGLGVAVLPENARQLAPAVQVVAVDLVAPIVAREVMLLRPRHRSLSTAASTLKQAILERA